MFALADAERLRGLLEGAGFTEIVLDTVRVSRAGSIDGYMAEMFDLNPMLSELRERLEESQLDEVRSKIVERLGSFTTADDQVELPGLSLVAAASA